MATGFGKWGITNGSAAAQILAGYVTDELPEWGRLYRPRITSGLSGWRQLVVQNADVAAHLAKGWLLEPRLATDGNAVRRDLPVPEAESTVDGVRRVCSAVCTHLGGIVRWNDAENSWDCPLHGSRFGPDGSVLSGPATEPLRMIANGVSSGQRQ
ncbi:MAG: Rieske 2Fe-2S domain-containing protein [Candidatus Nanopelagicales bacterium]